MKADFYAEFIPKNKVVKIVADIFGCVFLLCVGLILLWDSSETMQSIGGILGIIGSLIAAFDIGRYYPYSEQHADKKQ